MRGCGELSCRREYGDCRTGRGRPKAKRQERHHDQRPQPSQPRKDDRLPERSHPPPIVNTVRQNSGVHALFPIVRLIHQRIRRRNIPASKKCHCPKGRGRTIWWPVAQCLFGHLVRQPARDTTRHSSVAGLDAKLALRQPPHSAGPRSISTSPSRPPDFRGCNRIPIFDVTCLLSNHST
jgi:hypothetical protein